MAKQNDRKELAKALVGKFGITQKQAERFIQTFFDVVSDGIHYDKQVKVKGLGTFKVIEVKDRESVNIKTGERFMIEGREKITFTPDAVMKELVNKPFSQFETVALNDGVDFSDIDAAYSETEAQSVDSLSSTEIVTIVPEEQPVIVPVMTEPVEEPVEETEQTTVETKVEQVIPEEDETFAEEAVVEEPVVEEPVAEEPVAEEPVAEEPVAEELLEAETANEPIQEDVAVVEEPVEEPVMEEDTDDVHKEEPSQEQTGNEEEEAAPVAKAALLSAENGDKEREETEEESETDNQEDTDMEDNSSIWGKLLAFVVVAALAFGVGYLLGNKFTSKREIPIGATEMIEGTVHDSIMVDSAQINDSILKAKDALIKAKVDSVTRMNEARNESIRAARAKVIAEEKRAEEEKKQQAIQQQQSSPSEAPLSQKDASQVLQNARTIMAHGAYNIVGTAQTITVKKGQTMKSISRTYLGSEMACYIQCHNNVAEVKEGMQIKIPKLELKKKKK
ncbi:MAG: HU family DNA-binding protein [Prevotella sp.]|nr:HU family DNA-binding protein [Prevotella sp.]